MNILSTLVRDPFNGGVAYDSSTCCVSIIGYYDAPKFEHDCNEWAVVIEGVEISTHWTLKDAEEALAFRFR